MVYNGSRATLLILDNATTAMTGRQEHPGTGKKLDGTPAPAVDLEAICRAVGVPDVSVVDPYDLPATEAAIKSALAFAGPSVVITRRPCMLIPHEIRPKMHFELDQCTYCGMCLRIGCPAINRVAVEKDGKTRFHPEIDPLLCNGCGVCGALCKFGALEPRGGAETAKLVEG